MALLIRQRYELEESREETSRFGAGTGGPVKNLDSVFAAYLIGMGGVFHIFG